MKTTRGKENGGPLGFEDHEVVVGGVRGVSSEI